MSIYDSLNTEQKEAVTHTDGPLLILAGAGSGKTRVLVHRIAYLIEHKGVEPYNILAITFTNKAAGEMRERVDKLIDYGANQVWVATFHSTCVRILRRYAELIGYDNNFTIYDADDSKTVMKNVFKTLEVNPRDFKEKGVLNIISSLKDELVDEVQYAKNASGDFKEEKIAECYKEYQETLRKSNAMDFDDIIMNTVRLFKTNPDVLNNYQDRFRYIMVDEYQDTNTAQFELVNLLAKKYRNLCVVGDDDQSIYRFRGANIRNILDFEKNYSDAHVIKLEQNYRSTQNILDAANAVISNNSARKTKRLWTDKGEGERIHFRIFDTAYEEAQYISDDIGKMLRKGKYRPSQCAVLYRTNAQSRLLEEQFVRNGMPYNLVGGTNFYERKEIKDMLAYLRAIDNAKDDLQVRRIINVPKRGIGQTSVDRVAKFARDNNISFYEACEDAEYVPSIGAAASKIYSFVNTIRVFRASYPTYGLRGLINDVIEKTGYVKEMEESEEEDAKDRIENIYELVNKITLFEEEHEGEDASLGAFLEEVALVAATDDLDGSERTPLMTLHAAKGLEFEKVYIAGCEDGVFPSSMCISDPDPSAIEEERRLAYVGITRAKEDLTLTYAKSRMNRGEYQYNPVSRFLKEIPGELLDGSIPKQRKFEEDDAYGEGSYERNTFKSKPFGGSYGAYSQPVAAKPVMTKTLPKASLTRGVAKSDGLDYGVGDRVSHIKFGLGTVTAIVDEPRDYKVTVEFDSCGQKIMYAAFAKLQKQ